MAVLIENNAVSRLASSLTTGATSVSVTSGEGAKFPAPSGGDWFPATLLKSDGTFEICRCTARTADVLTITRAQEGTSAKSFSAGDRIELRVTKAAFAEMLQATKNLSDVGNATTARQNIGAHDANNITQGIIAAARLSGSYSINVTGTLSGNATTASTLQTPRTINGVSFNGSANITIFDSTKLAKAGDVMTGALASEYASQSRLVRAPGGASYLGPASSVGTIKITLPKSWSNTMLRLRVGLYDYSSAYGECVLELSGYTPTANSAWFNTSARILGRHRFGAGAEVRFAHDGTNCCILIGTTGLTLSYLKVVVEDAYLSYAGVDSGWDSGWSISQITSEAGITVSSTQPFSNNNPAEMLNWQKYGGHYIFDASNGKAPNGAACSDSDPTYNDWTPTHPVLMGWSGANTYPVKVARAAKAEQLVTARTINGVSFDGTANITVYDSTKYPTSGGQLTGYMATKTTGHSVGHTSGDGALSVRGDLTSGAVMTFHRAGYYAINMGLDTDNVFRLGGWSNGANTYRMEIDTAGNLITKGGYSSGGDISIVKGNAWLTLDSLSSGGAGIEQGAGISIGESGYKGAACLHLTYTGDGYGHFGMGVVDGTSGIMAQRAMSFLYTSPDTNFHGALKLPSNTTLEGVGANGLKVTNANGTIEIGNRNTSYTHYGSSTGNHYFYGNIVAQSNITAYSDVRLKADLQVIPGALGKIAELNGYTYERTDLEGPRETGLVAQELQKVLPEAVREDAESGHLHVAYGNLAGLFVEAIKELSAKIDAQAALIAELRGEG